MLFILWAIFGAISAATYIFGYKVYEYRNYRDSQVHNENLAKATAIAAFFGMVLGNFATIVIYEVIFCV